MEFRCANTLHLKVGNDLVEVKCRAKRCGAGSGNVVLHRFSLTTGELVETLTFKDPKVIFNNGLSEQTGSPKRALTTSTPTQKERKDDDNSADRAAVRSA